MPISKNDPTTEAVADSNQTSFTWEEPLFEAAPVVSRPQVEVVAPQPWYKKPVIVGGLITLVLLLLLLLLLVSSRRTTQQRPANLTFPAATIVPTESPMQKKIRELRSGLQAADPSVQTLPFPPVDLELQLTPPSNR